MTWFYLALLAPLLFAIVNLLDDNLLQHVYRNAHTAAAVSGCFAIFPAAIILALNFDNLSMSAAALLLSMVAGFLTVVGYYCYFRGLEQENPSVVAALFSITPAIIPFIAYFLVGERLSAQAAIGFALVTVAAFAYSLTDVKKFKISKALLPVTAAALIFDGAALANKYVYTKVDFYPAFFYFSIGMFVAGMLFLFTLGFVGKKFSAKNVYQKNSVKLLSLLAMVEVIGMSAEFVQDKALSLGSVSLVRALGNLQPLYIVLISLLLFPLFPKYFRDAESGSVKIKVALLVTMVVGAYLAVQ